MEINVERVKMAQLPWVNRAVVYNIFDIPTGLSYNVVGEFWNQRHADYVCATPRDTEIKRQTAGARGFNDNWPARSCILTIGDRRFSGSTHNAAHPASAEGYPSLARAGYTAARVGHSGHFCFWVEDSITGQPGQRLSATQIAYQTSMRNAAIEAHKLALNMTIEEEDEIVIPTPQNFNILGNKVVLEGLNVEGTIYVPARALAENLGYDVSWDRATSTAVIAKPSE